MGIIASLRQPAAPRRMRGAAFPAADLSRLTSSWTTDPGAVNRWLRWELRTLRARSRQLVRGDAYGAGFVGACVRNIAGPAPFTLQAKVKKPRGKLDTKLNKLLETSWIDWGRPGCEITRKLSLRAVYRLLVETLARDGELLVRTLRGRQFGPYGFALQLLDIDRLDEDKNEELSRGAIKMGVEVDAVGMPVRYHVLRRHPGEHGVWGGGAPREYDVLPAEGVYHLFVPHWPEQVRGLPWMHAAMTRLWHLGGFEEAAVINARVGATKLAVLQSKEGDAPVTLATGQDSKGNLITDAEPGQYWTLPGGYELGSWDPTFPDASVEPFIRACLRGAAAGTGMAYHSFAQDPAQVNYSTARVALLDERDMWMALQDWFVEHFCERLFGDWLESASLVGALAVGDSRDLRLREVRFQPKRWAWVDPQKEVAAKVTALENRLTSHSRIAAEQGEDFEDILDEVASDQALAAEKGVTLASAPAAAQPAPKPAGQPASEEPDPAEET